MASLKIHLEVAYIYAKNHKEYDNRDFYLGVMAPDSPNLEGFAPKEERWMAHQREKDLNRWKERVINFYYDNKDKYNKYFIFGYLFHILTDIIFDEKYYLEIRKKILEDDISLEESHNVLVDDMNNYGTNFKEFNEIKELIQSSDEYYDILNINSDLLRNWIYKNIEDQEVKEYKYINKDIVKDIEKDMEELLQNI